MKRAAIDRQLAIVIAIVLGAMVALHFCGEARAETTGWDTLADACDITVGASTNRYALDRRARLGYSSDGRYLLTVGAACEVVEISRLEVALVVGANAGTVADSSAFERDRSAIGLAFGIKFLDGAELFGGQIKIPAITVGISPHYAIGEPANRARSYGATVFGQLDIFEAIGKAWETVEEGGAP